MCDGYLGASLRCNLRSVVSVAQIAMQCEWVVNFALLFVVKKNEDYMIAFPDATISKLTSTSDLHVQGTEWKLLGAGKEAASFGRIRGFWLICLSV